MKHEFKNIDEAIEFIKANYWDGLEYAPGRKNAIDKFSRESDLRNQHANATSGSHDIFFFLHEKIRGKMEIRKVKINPNLETANET
jgi:hypothetical protein